MAGPLTLVWTLCWFDSMAGSMRSGLPSSDGKPLNPESLGEGSRGGGGGARAPRRAPRGCLCRSDLKVSGFWGTSVSDCRVFGPAVRASTRSSSVSLPRSCKRLVFHRRATSASTAPCTSRRSASYCTALASIFRLDSIFTSYRGGSRVLGPAIVRACPCRAKNEHGTTL